MGGVLPRHQAHQYMHLLKGIRFESRPTASLSPFNAQNRTSTTPKLLCRGNLTASYESFACSDCALNQGCYHMCFWPTAFGRLRCAFQLSVTCTGRLVLHRIYPGDAAILCCECVWDTIKQQGQPAHCRSCIQLFV